ncbi:hypothetical protein CW749_24430 [Vibrio sp. vnigr-6D03]|nr:hypothetical protein CW749_24430 [Vibrio sp. vnigr-6D03]
MLGFHAVLPILDLEPLDLQIGALPENQAILAEPSTLRWFEYISVSNLSYRIDRFQYVIYNSVWCRSFHVVRKKTKH